jgi:hypothetical protein
MLSPRRIVFTPQNRRVVVERMELETSGFLNRFHRRRGYQQPYAADLAMAISVDAVIVAMVFWALSGLWLWWERRLHVVGIAVDAAMGMVGDRRRRAVLYRDCRDALMFVGRAP